MTKQPFQLVTTLELAGNSIGVYGSFETPMFLVGEVLCALQAHGIVDNLCTGPHDIGVLKSPDCQFGHRWYTTRDGLRNILAFITPLHADELARDLRKQLGKKMGIQEVEPNTFHVPGEEPTPKVAELMEHPAITSMYHLIDTLKQSSLFATQAFRCLYGEDADMEDYPEFVAMQKQIEAAIASTCSCIAKYVQEQIVSA